MTATAMTALYPAVPAGLGTHNPVTARLDNQGVFGPLLVGFGKWLPVVVQPSQKSHLLPCGNGQQPKQEGKQPGKTQGFDALPLPDFSPTKQASTRTYRQLAGAGMPGLYLRRIHPPAACQHIRRVFC